MNEFLKIKNEIINNGWTEIEEKTTLEGWGDGKIGYTILIRRPDWHGKDSFSLIGRNVELHASCNDASNPDMVLKAISNLRKLAKRAWDDFPDDIPVQNAFGELVEEILCHPFAEGTNIIKQK